ncbi:MAG: branched-chain amino acid aminotransferase [Bacteroidota bacterium]
MSTLTKFAVEKAIASRLSQVNFDAIVFGGIPSDHMLKAVWRDGKWGEARIMPFADLRMSPFTVALHYGQTIFEGMKAFRRTDGDISVFRPHKHLARFNRSAVRMAMPEVPEAYFVEGLRQLVELDKKWVADQAGFSLYLRPMMFASEARIGLRIPNEFTFLILASPAPPYYTKALRMKVETEYVRAAKGGAGFAKCGGNYGAACFPTQLAIQQGFDQLLWTDARDHQFFEEAGNMNVFFVVENQLITPPQSDSILDGVTRDSLLALGRDMGMEVVEKAFGIDDLVAEKARGRLKEVFGAGTAAVVAPIQSIQIGAHLLELDADYPVALELKRRLEAIRSGQSADTRNWNLIVAG